MIKFEWNSIQNAYISFQQNSFENVIYKMSVCPGLSVVNLKQLPVSTSRWFSGRFSSALSIESQ